ncbi:Putative heme iron utilization protein [Minicystis rosea]|nr:Putative heme iron utilization protein [Minicystis rosea]
MGSNEPRPDGPDGTNAARAAELSPAPRTPTHAERARTVAARVRTATLSTIARDPEGYPYGSLVTVADDRGRPLLLISQLAEHTQNLTSRAEASILLAEVAPPNASPLSVARVTLLGPCRPVPEADREAARAAFLAVHPDAEQYASFKDFAFHRLEPSAVRYVGGFGRMSWVSAADYLAAEPDPIAPQAEGILAHMNDDHADAVLAYARGLAGEVDATIATMTAVDRYGFDLALETPRGSKTARLAFASEVASTDEVRRALVALVKTARAAIRA